jgi:hypothetical protein
LRKAGLSRQWYQLLDTVVMLLLAIIAVGLLIGCQSLPYHCEYMALVLCK